MSLGLADFRICSTASNSSAFERWLISPVWSMNSGGDASALTLSTAALSVPATSGFAGLLNPRWLSLICTKLRSPWAVFSPIAEIRLKLYDFSTPPWMTHKAPVPAQAMHFRNPRRSMPSWLWSCRISSLLSGLLMPFLLVPPAVTLDGPGAQPCNFARGQIFPERHFFFRELRYGWLNLLSWMHPNEKREPLVRPSEWGQQKEKGLWLLFTTRSAAFYSRDLGKIWGSCFRPGIKWRPRRL